MMKRRCGRAAMMKDSYAGSMRENGKRVGEALEKMEKKRLFDALERTLLTFTCD